MARQRVPSNQSTIMHKKESRDWHVTTESVDFGKHGKDYELDIAKYLFKRLLDANLTNFKFTREKRGLGKFDDLAYAYEDEGKRKRFCLIQLKHIVDTTKKIDYNALANNKGSYFLLQKYFSHFQEAFRALGHDKDFGGYELEALIICTNMGMSRNLGEISLEVLPKAGLFQHSGRYYKLKMTDPIKRTIFAESYRTEREKLADELVLCIMLNKFIDINSLKKDEHISMLKKYHVALANYVLDISNKKLKTEFLEPSEVDDYKVAKFRQCFLDSFVKLYTENKNDTIDELKKKFRIKWKLAENLKNQFFLYESLGCPIKFLELNRLEIRQSFGDGTLCPEDITTLPDADRCSDKIDYEINRFLDLLIFVTEEQDNAEIISQEIEPDLLNSFNTRMNNWYHLGSYQDCLRGSLSLKKRNWITKKNLLSEAMESFILFHGRQINLKQLITDTNLICPQMLLNTFCSKLVTIGCKPQSFADMSYISRLFSQEKTVDKDALISCLQDIFIISKGNKVECVLNALENISYQDISDIRSITKKSRIIYTDKSFNESDFKEFVKTYQSTFSKKNIHWLKANENKTFDWQQTHGSLLHLQDYFITNHNDKSLVNENHIINNHLAIIAGEPGMGKTILLNKMFKSFANLNLEEEELNWIIQIPLKDCYGIPNNVDSHEYQKEIVDFLATFGNARDEFSKIVLQHYLKKNKGITLLFDGFDELHSKEDQDNILKLVTYLTVNCNLKHICLTTRPHYVEKLENFLGTLAFSMEAINENEQVNFLKKYWERNNLQKLDDLSQIAQNVMKCNRTFYDQNKEYFLGVPLQLHMFADVYLQKAKEEFFLSNSLHITTLLEIFLQTMYNIYFEKPEENVLQRKQNRQLLISLLDDIHQDFALRYGGILSQDEAQLFERKNTYMDDQLLSIGIVYKTGGQFYFTHQTFADYLIAKRLVEATLNESNLRKPCAELLNKVLLSQSHPFFIYLYDFKLTEAFPLHQAVLNQDIDKVRRFSEEETNSRDTLGRTTLYYALQYRHYDLIDILIKRGARVDNEDPFTITLLSQFILHNYQAETLGISSEMEETTFTQNWYRSIAQQVLTDTMVDYPYELLFIYKFEIEASVQNWPVVEMLIQNKFTIGSLFNAHYNFRILIKKEAPMEIIFKFLQNKTIQKGLIFDDRTSQVHLLSVVKYILNHPPERLEELLEIYPEDVMHLLNLLSNNCSTEEPLLFSCLLKAYKSISYKDLSGKSLSSLLFAFERRATNFTILTEFLFAHGLRCDSVYTRLTLEDFLGLPFFECLHFIHLKTSVEKFEKIMSKKKNLELHEMQLLNILKDFENECSLTPQTNIKEAMCHILQMVWNSSKGLELIDLFYKLQQAVLINDISTVSEYLIIAKVYNWINPISNACNSIMETSQTAAQKNRMKKVLKLLQDKTKPSQRPHSKRFILLDSFNNFKNYFKAKVSTC